MNAKRADIAKLSNDPDARLSGYLENCKIPLSSDDWIGFFKELDAQKLRYLFPDWISGRRKWFEWLSKKKLDDRRAKDSLILTLHQLQVLRVIVEHQDRIEKEGGLEVYLRRRIAEHELKDLKKGRDRKPNAPHPIKNWLEPMPIFNEGEPCGYVQATGQPRKKIETLLRRLNAKPTSKLAKKERGKPKFLFGFETNCQVLDQWLGTWCDQTGEQKNDLILDEALILATRVADAKNTVARDRLARLRRILSTHAKPVGTATGYDFDFDFLSSSTACAEQIKLLRESCLRFCNAKRTD